MELYILIVRMHWFFKSDMNYVSFDFKQVIEDASKRQGVQIWIERIKMWLNELFPQQSYSDDERACDNQSVSSHESNGNLPIWFAAQKAVPRYEGLLSSVGPRGRLLRKLLTWTGLIPSAPRTSLELDSDSTISETYLRFEVHILQHDSLSS